MEQLGQQAQRPWPGLLGPFLLLRGLCCVELTLSWTRGELGERLCAGAMALKRAHDGPSGGGGKRPAR